MPPTCRRSNVNNIVGAGNLRVTKRGKGTPLQLSPHQNKFPPGNCIITKPCFINKTTAFLEFKYRIGMTPVPAYW